MYVVHQNALFLWFADIDSMQWCTGSGFWSPIRPDIENCLDLDWISFPFQTDPEPDYPN